MSTRRDEPANLISAYMPADRRYALAWDLPMPVLARGAALFADISGFTLMTESLTRSLGPRQGAEQLGQYLNQVYDALIAEVDRYGGSVIGFSGDAITCWFDDEFLAQVYAHSRLEPAPARQASTQRAVTCALAMMAAMQAFAALEISGQGIFALKIKAAVASGYVHRFTVGDPQEQRIDVVAGETLLRMAAAEHMAERGELLIDAASAHALDGQLEIAEWRQSEDQSERFAVVSAIQSPAAPAPWPALPPTALDTQAARPWLSRAIDERLRQGKEEFPIELRPAAALFLRFAGINFESDPQAATKLDGFIAWVQSIVRRYEGSLIQLTIGEKGSYMYIAFGAPRAHEDDPLRAIRSALELRAPPAHTCVTNLQIGVTLGTMRTGAYGGKTRRTYGVLGDDVNLAARLMQHANPAGEILVSAPLQQAVRSYARLQPQAPIRVKGKTALVPVAALLALSERLSAQQSYHGALVGRQDDLQRLTEAGAVILGPQGHFGGLVLIDGEAGVGKSRLAHELHQRLAQLAAEQQVQPAQWIDLPSDPVLTQSLNPFKRWLRSYADQDAGLTTSENQARFDAALDLLLAALAACPDQPSAAALAEDLERTRSMLAALLGLHQADSLYERLEPKLRFENTLIALRSLILAESLRQPVLLHLEDAHWLDSDSQSLVRMLVRNVAAYPFILLLTGRYCDGDNEHCLDLADGEWPLSLSLRLSDLALPEVRALALNHLPATAAQAAPAVSDDLLHFLYEKSNGNPLFLEELIAELNQRGLLHLEAGRWRLAAQRDTDVPAGLNALLIARLDRLEDELKRGVQTASVIGREFEAPVLDHMLPDTAIPPLLQRAQAEHLWTEAGSSRYSFRQSLLRDAAYAMQSHARVQQQHSKAAQAILSVHANDPAPHYADLAYHYSQAHAYAATFRYARLAAEAAAAQYANHQAIQLYQQALDAAAHLKDATDAPGESIETLRMRLHAALGELLVITAQPDLAEQHLTQALELAEHSHDQHSQARACRWLARLSENRSQYPQALAWIERGLLALGDEITSETSELLNNAGLINSRRGDYSLAQAQAERCLEIAQTLADQRTLARAHNLFGHIARLQGDRVRAIEQFNTALQLYQQAEDLNGQALAHNQLANALFNLGRWQEAQHHFSQARTLFDQIGDLYHVAFVDNNLGWIALNQGRLDQALTYYTEGLERLQQYGGSPYVFGAFHNNLGATYIRLGDLAQANQHLETSQGYFERAGARDWLAELYRHKAGAALRGGDLPLAQAHAEQALALAQELKMRAEEGNALRVLGEIAAAQGNLPLAQQHLTNSISILGEVGEDFERVHSLLALARLVTPLPDEVLPALTALLPLLERLGAAQELAEAQLILSQHET